jgi:hypothetical protein
VHKSGIVTESTRNLLRELMRYYTIDKFTLEVVSLTLDDQINLAQELKQKLIRLEAQRKAER